MKNKNQLWRVLVGIGAFGIAANTSGSPSSRTYCVVSNLLGLKPAYSQITAEPKTYISRSDEDAIDTLVKIHKTEVDGRIDVAKDYEKVIALLQPIERFENYDFSKLAQRKRGHLAEIFNDYAVALKLLKGKIGDDDFGKVIHLYKVAINLDANLLEPKFNLAFLIYQRRLGNYKEAIGLVDEFLMHKPDDIYAAALKKKLESLK